MYIDGMYDAKKNVVRVAERDQNGQRNIVEHDVEHVFYYTHPSGTHRSMYGDPCKKFSSNDQQKFRRELNRIQAVLNKQGQPQHKIFESDINPVFRVLESQYKGAEAPVLNLAFFDIETGFDEERGFAPVDDPFNPVTAISVYLSHMDRLITLVLLPPTLALAEGREIADKFPDTFLFDDECELLRAFMGVCDDIDVYSGWNCIDKNEPVWLKDRITKLSRVVPQDETYLDGKVLATNNSGMKPANKLVLSNGKELVVSDEHRIPVMSKLHDQYKNKNSLKKTRTDLTVAEIKKLIASGQDVFMEVNLRNNTNRALTYGAFLRTNLEDIWENDWFDISVHDDRKSIIAHNEKSPVKHSRYISSSNDYPALWSAKKMGFGIDQIKTYLEGRDSITLLIKNSRSSHIDLNREIGPEIMQLLGFVFTDGTLVNNGATLYSTDVEMLRQYRDIAKTATNGRYTTERFNIKKGCARTRITFRHLGLLRPMIFSENNKKSLSLEMLSMLSSEQFEAFLSGIIDGDGWITKYMIGICNYDGSIPALVNLLNWNGVYASSSENWISIPNTNHEMFDRLSLLNNKRRKALSDIEKRYFKNSSNKILTKFFDDGCAIVKIRSIEETNEMVEMADIQTEDGYFTCSGMRVHNSTFYDIPYIVNRIKKIINEDATRDLCLWRQKPRQKMVMKYGKEHETYDLVGRVHLDYLELYQKHNPQQQHSYRLDYIGEVEVGDNKIPYEGTLDDLYKKDFFKFIEYSRQDVTLLVKIDKEKKFIELANQIAHVNCVQLKTTMGTVALVEQAIILEMHEMGLVAPNRKPRDEIEDIAPSLDDDEDEDDDDEHKKKPVVGAYVAKPKVGIHDHVGAVDIKSLYPSTIRALNISPETIVGQIRSDETKALVAKRITKGTPRAEAWDGIFATLEVDHMMARDDTSLTIDFDDGTTKVMTGQQLYDYIFEPRNHLCVSANGTIFRTDEDGIIPLLLAKWYSQRKAMQAKKGFYGKLSKGFEIDLALAQKIKDALNE